MARLSEMPLRVWVILPLTLLFGAVVFRMSWNIPAHVAPGQVFWWLAICATVIGYFFILRFLSQPVLTERLKVPWIRAGTINGTTIGLIAATVYLYHQVPVSIAVISKVVLWLAIVVNAGGYFFLVLLIKPDLSLRFKTRPVRLGVSALITIALISLTIHTIRFLPSPEAVYIESKVMAILLLAALIAVYPLVIKYIWCVWREKESSYPTWLPR